MLAAILLLGFWPFHHKKADPATPLATPDPVADQYQVAVSAYESAVLLHLIPAAEEVPGMTPEYVAAVEADMVKLDTEKVSDPQFFADFDQFDEDVDLLEARIYVLTNEETV